MERIPCSFRGGSRSLHPSSRKGSAFTNIRQTSFFSARTAGLPGLSRSPSSARTPSSRLLTHLRDKHGLSVEDTLAVGDAANHLAMLEAAGLGVAFHAKPRSRPPPMRGSTTAILAHCFMRKDTAARIFLQIPPPAIKVSSHAQRRFEFRISAKGSAHTGSVMTTPCSISSRASMSPAGFMPAIRRSWQRPSRRRRPRGRDRGASWISRSRGFGRRGLPFTAEEIERLVAYQIGAANALATYVGARLGYVKVHGALAISRRRTKRSRSPLRARSKWSSLALAFSLPPDRNWRRRVSAGTCRRRRNLRRSLLYGCRPSVERSCSGAVLHDAGDAAERVLAMVLEGAIITSSDKRLAARHR